MYGAFLSPVLSYRLKRILKQLGGAFLSSEKNSEAIRSMTLVLS